LENWLNETKKEHHKEHHKEKLKEDVSLGIGDIFSRHLRHFPDYGILMNNFSTIVLTIDEYRRKYPKFNELLLNFESNLHKIRFNLETILLMPLHRLPRYFALLSALKTITPTTHPEYNTFTNILKILTGLFTELSMTINQTENDRIHKLLSILSSIEGGEGYMTKNRKFLYEGQLDLHFNKEGKKKRNRYFFLFSDVLLQCKVKHAQNTAKKFVLQLAINLHEIMYITKPINNNNSISITWKTPETGDWELVARNQKHRDLWYDRIQACLV